jgi:hypothetical protein
MNKNIIWILVVLLVLIGGVLVWKNIKEPTEENNSQQTSENVAQAGEHCGGNMANAKTCATGYECQPDPQSHLPFGDVGGICVAVSVKGEF